MSDLIDRQAAIYGVKTLHDVAWKNWHEPTLSANAVLDMIKQLPPAQQDIEEKLYQYKCYITDKEDLQHEVIHTGDIRRATGWKI